MIRTLEDANLDDGDRKLLNDVSGHGWHVLIIKEGNRSPGWAFSVGLYHNYGHPEVVVFGLPQKLMHAVVNGIGDGARDGSPFKAGDEYADILEGVNCMFKPVAKRWYRPFLGYARWFYRGDEFPALQCIWPDKQQNYPWASNFKPEWVWAQPLLFKTNPVPARVLDLFQSMGYEEDDKSTA